MSFKDHARSGLARRLLATGAPIELALPIAECCYPMKDVSESCSPLSPIMEPRECSRTTESFLKGQIDLDALVRITYGVSAEQLSMEALGLVPEAVLEAAPAATTPTELGTATPASLATPTSRLVGADGESALVHIEGQPLAGDRFGSFWRQSVERIEIPPVEDGEEATPDPDGTRRWYRNHETHRVSGPAVLWWDNDGNWYRNGVYIDYDSELSRALSSAFGITSISAEDAFDLLSRLDSVLDRAWVARVLLANQSPNLDLDFRSWLMLWAQFDGPRPVESDYDAAADEFDPDSVDSRLQKWDINDIPI